MNSIPGRETENWTLSFNQPKETHKKGLLLGTDFRHAVEFSRSGRARTPTFRPSFEAVSPLYTALRNGQTSGARPAVSQACGPVRSRSVQRERYTTRGALCTGATEGAVRTIGTGRPGAVLSGHQLERRPRAAPPVLPRGLPPTAQATPRGR